jgi:thymidine kinase
MGSIELIIGPMFSGKTSELHSRIMRCSYARQPSIIIKYANDDRYTGDDVLSTHSNIRQGSMAETKSNAAIRVVSAMKLSEVDVAGIPEKVIGVDEGQFYPDLIEMCEKWANMGKRVIISALDGDFKRAPFGQVCALVPKCDAVEKKKGICMICRNIDSSFSKKISTDQTLIDIGHQNKYQAVCRDCYFMDAAADEQIAAAAAADEQTAAAVGQQTVQV